VKPRSPELKPSRANLSLEPSLSAEPIRSNLAPNLSPEPYSRKRA
jgi:hypothetical protein